jgi:pyruvate dehydrogenase E2 component (dihydrolipoamide acetyltransferase)
MATAVIMPRQGQSVESCIITKWYKKKGDEVKVDDLLFAYETDKASFEETAKVSGILLDIFFNEGDEAPVLTNVAVIGKQGENTTEFKPKEGSDTKAATTSTNDEVVKNHEPKVETKTPILTQETRNSIASGISPRAKNTAEKLGVSTSILTGSGPKGRVIERDVIEASQNQPRLTPLAQEIATTTGQSVINGSGFGGKALATDLGAGSYSGTIDYTDAKLSNVRKIIAASMHASLQNSAQLTHHMGADVRKLLEYRNMVKKALDKGSPHNITLNDMVCWCVIRALKQMPEANSHFLGTNIRTFNKVHLGIAVDTPRGLMVPVVRNADDLSLSGLSSQLKSVAEACRKGSIDPALLQSSAASFTISNLGNYGVEMFTPVINLPQVAILGVCTIINRPTDLCNGAFGFVPYIGLSLTYDHRAIDGGPATLFLREIKNEIENFVGQ